MPVGESTSHDPNNSKLEAKHPPQNTKRINLGSCLSSLDFRQHIAQK